MILQLPLVFCSYNFFNQRDLVLYVICIFSACLGLIFLPHSGFMFSHLGFLCHLVHALSFYDEDVWHDRLTNNVHQDSGLSLSVLVIMKAVADL